MSNTIYNKLLDPVSDIITSTESILTGAFGVTTGDQRESYKRIHTHTWGIHTLMMDIITSLGVEHIATRPYIFDRFHSLMRPINSNVSDLMTGFDGELNEEQQLIMDFVVTAVRSIEHMMNNLWQYSLIKHDKLEYNPATFDLTRLFQHLREQLPKYHIPYVSLPIRVVGDEEHLRYVIGEIAFNIEHHAYIEEVNLKTELFADSVVLSVIDEGYGFNYDNSGDIFTPFWQSDESNDGLGLGLYLAKVFTEKSGGTIDIRSEQQNGTEVKLTLPLAK